MTRINLVDPSELHRKHLIAEIHELPRIFTLARKAQNKPRNIPEKYILGKGHVLFFYKRLGFLADRYEKLCDEMRKRKYNVNQISRNELLGGIDLSFQVQYTPNDDEINLNRERIKARTKIEWK
jgi:deoxyribonuclease (pyrimidine dimer)